MASGWVKRSDISLKLIIYLILPLVLLLVVFPSVLQPNSGFISSKFDTLLVINSDMSVANNPFSLWNSNWLSGVPEYALPLSEIYYPPFLPGALLGNDLYIINILILIHLFLAYLFFFKMSGLITRNPEIRMIFSTIYMFSGILLSRVDAGHLSIIFALAWIPLMYYAFFKIIWKNDISAINITLFSVSFALIFFTGAVYYLFYSCSLLAIFFVYYLLKKKISNPTTIAVIFSVGLGILLLSIKLVPVIISSSVLGRIDVIDPLGDGGSLENNIASFVIGTPIDHAFAGYESIALIGIIPVLLLIIALVFGREDWTIPAFFAILFALIWTDGGKTLLSFVHLLPGLNNFRVAGRMLGALLPLLLLFSIYGLDLLLTRLRSNDRFTVLPQQKKIIIYGVCLLGILKLLELPFQEIGSLDLWISFVIVALFVLLLYLNKVTIKNFMIFIGVTLAINAVLIYRNFSGIDSTILIKSLIVVGIVCVALLLFNREYIHKPFTNTHVFCGLFLIGIFFMVMGNFSYLSVSNPELDQSPAVPIIEKIKSFNDNTSQIWVLETGWSFQHEDFTYWFIKNGIHPVRAYYPNYLLSGAGYFYKIGNISYSTVNYIVDNQYLENGNQNIENVTFKVQNISIYRPEYVLPNTFIIRNNSVIPVNIEKYSADEVCISGQFAPGDIAVLKTSYYPGWKVEGNSAANAGNLVAGQLSSSRTTVTFKFDPDDAKLGTALTIIGIILVIVLIIKRKTIEKYFEKLDSHKKEHIPLNKQKK